MTTCKRCYKEMGFGEASVEYFNGYCSDCAEPSEEEEER